MVTDAQPSSPAKDHGRNAWGILHEDVGGCRENNQQKPQHHEELMKHFQHEPKDAGKSKYDLRNPGQVVNVHV